MTFLASDALRGRGSGTPDELVAATFAGAQFEHYGIAPAGDHGGYVQEATVERPVLTAPPELHFSQPGEGAATKEVAWIHGKEFLTMHLSETSFKGPLKRWSPPAGANQPTEGDKSLAGAVVLVDGKNLAEMRERMSAAVSSGAIAVLMPATPDVVKHWEERAKGLPNFPARVQGEGDTGLGGSGYNIFALSEATVASLKNIPDGTVFSFDGALGQPETTHTWNAVGKLAGSDAKSVILLTAHLDHLGVGAAVNGDTIYNGADDDASGTAAVLELARALASGPKPRRTVVFALFGSEETGGLGSTWFEAHPPVPLNSIAANLEFEMIGRPDPKYPPQDLWLTGWERSNLGPALAAHGAKLVADARPEEEFFMRSDNYVLAKKGVVAQTVSSYGMHADYHQPSDDLSHIDFAHMTAAIGSLIQPIEWLVNSDFRPEWKAGGKP